MNPRLNEVSRKPTRTTHFCVLGIVPEVHRLLQVELALVFKTQTPFQTQLTNRVLTLPAGAKAGAAKTAVAERTARIRASILASRGDGGERCEVPTLTVLHSSNKGIRHMIKVKHGAIAVFLSQH